MSWFLVVVALVCAVWAALIGAKVITWGTYDVVLALSFVAYFASLLVPGVVTHYRRQTGQPVP